MSGTWELWIVIAGLGLGSFGLRFMFLGFMGGREQPVWLLRHLRYTAVAIMPALVAPMVVWPEASGGTPDPVRMAAAAVAFFTGYYTQNTIAAIVIGAATFLALTSWV